jgi:phenylacetate-coenzyme A ligase PaaK-like adenylate-forming protein
METRADRIREFQKQALPKTIEHARNAFPYYRQSLSSVDSASMCIRDLGQIPILSKQDIVAHENELVWQPAPTDYLSFTSGTTTGKPLMLRRSHQEIEQFQNLWEQVLVSESESDSTKTQSIVLELRSNYHGITTASLSDGVMRMPCASDTHFNAAIRMMKESHVRDGNEAHVRSIRAPLGVIERLTLFCMAKGIELKDLPIQQIAVNGHYVSTRWRRVIEEYWQAAVFDTYSLTEFPDNGAGVCDTCGWQHLLVPTAIPECVHPTSHTPVTEGPGVLLLSGLFPFSQRQLLLRYWTGDLIERGPRCEMDDFSFKVLGRLTWSVVRESERDVEVLISSLSLFDALEEVPELDRFFATKNLSTPTYLPLSVLRQVSVRAPAEVHFVDDSLETSRLTVKFGVTYPPTMHRERANAVARQVRESLLNTNRALAMRVEQGKIELLVEAVGPEQKLEVMRFA